MNETSGIVIKLNDDAPFNLHTLFDSIKSAGHIVASYAAEKHPIEMPDIKDKALFISFVDDNFNECDNMTFYTLVYKIAERFGVKQKDLKSGMDYPCIHHEPDVWSLLVKKSQWNDRYDEDYLISKETGKLVSDDDWDDIEDKADEDDSIYDGYSYYDFIEIVDTAKYDKKEPKFFLFAIFWKRNKEKYETAAKQSFKNSDKIWQQVRY